MNMKLHQLLTELPQKGVQLWAEGDKLRLRAPKGVITTEQRNSMTELQPELLKFLQQFKLDSETHFLPEIVPDPQNLHQPFPLSDMQQAYWVGRSEMLELGTVASFYFEIETNNLDLNRLNQAWQQLIERHEMLRAVFLPTGEQQILEQVPPYKIVALDLRESDSETVAVRSAKLRDEMSNNEIETDQWPLFDLRATLLNDRQTRLHFCFSLLITDGLSFQILMQELGELYYNPQPNLPPLEISVRDYVLAKVKAQNSPKYQQDLAYWQQRMEYLPPAPDLPLAKNPSSLQKHKFSLLKTQLDPQLWMRLKQRATELGITPFIILCSTYAQVLSLWSKNPHFTLNILYFNRLRLHPQVNDLVGNFSATILIEVDNSIPESFLSRTRQLHQRLMEDMEHDLISGVQVMRELNRNKGDIPRALMPVAMSSIVSQKNALKSKDSHNFLDKNPITYSNLRTPQIYLDYWASEENGALVVNWPFVKEVFPEGMVEEMFAAYTNLLQRLASEDEVWSEVSPQLMPPAQLKQQASMNATDAPLEEKLLHTLFTEQVLRRPEDQAVVTSTLSLTYKDLYNRANYLGYQLRQLGTHPNQLVAVVMEKGWEQVVGVLAILMAGSAYVPIDPSLPQERCWQLLEQSEVKVVLTQSWLEDTIVWPETVQRICVDTLEIDDADIPHLEPIQKWDDLAYIIYTSGSTGLPKGVMIDHRGAVNTVLDINQRFNISPSDRVLALSSLSFDLSVYDIFGTLAAGGTIVIPDASGTKEPAHWLELIVEHQITVWNSVPALMQLLIEYATSKQVLLSTLRLVMMSGDWLPLTLPSQIKALIGDIQVISLGGATEASIWSILYPIETVDPTWKSIPYGSPMVNQRFYVLNHNLEPCPVFVPGHLYIGGIGLAKGYWKNPEKTNSSFITHPRTGERLYRTGDLGRYLPDNNIEFLGREDFQVKIQGFRIECGEIETVLLQHPVVKATVVTAVGEQKAAKRLVAYVVPNAEPSPTPSELQEFLSKKLPQYMVPSAIVILPELPLTANGKVDRRSLPIPDTSNFSASNSILPRDSLELKLAEIWSDLLDVHPIGVKDNFFELGGYSFVAMRLMAQIQQEFGKTLPLATLLESPTIEHLANLLRSSTDTQTSSSLVAIQPSGNKPPFFCVHPVGGNVLCYVDLARHLGQEQPFYGLQATGLHGEQKPLNRIENMAGHYIAAIKTVQPQGPYHLGGWSLGGIVAFEMAQQLYQQGEEVASLTLIDSYIPTHQSEEIDDAMLVASVAKDLSNIVGKELPISVDELRQLQPMEQLDYILEQGKNFNILPPEVDRQQMHQMLEVFKANNQAMYSYKPQRLPGKLTLIFASEKLPTNQLTSWSKLAKASVVYQIEGNHYTIMQEPQVMALAEHLALGLI